LEQQQARWLGAKLTVADHIWLAVRAVVLFSDARLDHEKTEKRCRYYQKIK
jgi:hypothetical protein